MGKENLRACIVFFQILLLKSNFDVLAANFLYIGFAPVRYLIWHHIQTFST